MTDHVFTTRPGPGRFGTVVVCSCTWTSEPVRSHLVEATKRAHLQEVGR